MRYMSIDIETTGLNPETCQILQFGAVLEDTMHREVPIDRLPFLNLAIISPQYTGDAYALALNADIFKAYADVNESSGGVMLRDRMAEVIPIRELSHILRNWLTDHDMPRYGNVCAGKNFASFDLQFLKKHVPVFSVGIHRRIIDVGSMYLRPDDIEPPSLTECINRAGLNDVVTHDAIDDARLVIRLIRNAWNEYHSHKHTNR